MGFASGLIEEIGKKQDTIIDTQRGFVPFWTNGSNSNGFGMSKSDTRSGFGASMSLSSSS